MYLTRAFSNALTGMMRGFELFHHAGAGHALARAEAADKLIRSGEAGPLPVFPSRTRIFSAPMA